MCVCVVRIPNIRSVLLENCQVHTALLVTAAEAGEDGWDLVGVSVDTGAGTLCPSTTPRFCESGCVGLTP